MAKARAIVKRRKAVRNIRKITKTMQMIATAKFQKSLKRAVGTKPYTLKVRELVNDLAEALGDIRHPLLRLPGPDDRTGRIALIVITSNRGLAGAYNGSILRTAAQFIRQRQAAGQTVDLYVSGKKGISYFNFQRQPITQRYEQFADLPRFADVQEIADHFMARFTAGAIDSLHVAYMNFLSASTQRPDVLQILPLAGVRQAAEHLAQQADEMHAADEIVGDRPVHHAAAIAASGLPLARQRGLTPLHAEITYDFSPSASALLDELLPLTVKSALFQCFLDAVTSENVARMVAMKSATDNADKMVKALTMRYNRARQSQITTELSEIMGGVEAMKS